MFPERMLENLDASYGLVFSQPVLLALVERGHDAATTRTGSCSATRCRTWEERRPFHDVLAADPDVARRCSTTSALAACFDLDRALAHIDRGTVDALDAARRDGAA